jgi:uncharacterized membrane protein YfcA
MAIPLGFAVCTVGTMIGAGGGFYCSGASSNVSGSESGQYITAISLAVIFFNALSGTIAYGRMGRSIQIRAAVCFSHGTGCNPGVLSKTKYPASHLMQFRKSDAYAVVGAHFTNFCEKKKKKKLRNNKKNNREKRYNTCLLLI